QRRLSLRRNQLRQPAGGLRGSGHVRRRRAPDLDGQPQPARSGDRLPASVPDGRGLHRVGQVERFVSKEGASIRARLLLWPAAGHFFFTYVPSKTGVQVRPSLPEASHFCWTRSSETTVHVMRWRRNPDRSFFGRLPTRIILPSRNSPSNCRSPPL